MKNLRIILIIAICIIATNRTFAMEKIATDSIRLEINAWLKEFNNKDVKLNDKIIAAGELTFYYSGYYPGVLVKKMDSAFYYSEIAYNLSKNCLDSNLIYAAATRYAEYLSGVGNFSKAISILLDTKDKLNNYSYNDRINSEISNIYREAGDFKNVLKYKKINLEYTLKESHSKLGKIALYSNIGDAYSQLNMLDSALYYYNRDYENLMLIDQETLDKFDSMGFFSGLWGVIANMGEINYKLGKNEVAIIYFKQVIDAIYRHRFFKENTPEIILMVAKCYDKLDQDDLALRYARDSYRLANLNNDNKIITESSFYLSELFKQNNLPDSAYHYQSVYIHLKDSIYNNDQANKLAIISMEENIKQEKIKMQIEKEKHDREQNLILAGIGFFIPVFISLVFLVSKWSKKKSKIFTSLGIASLLMLFEFISLLIHPYVEKYTNHNVAFMYIILLIVASALVPIHHKMENYFKNYFQE